MSLERKINYLNAIRSPSSLIESLQHRIVSDMDEINRKSISRKQVYINMLKSPYVCAYWIAAGAATRP